MRRSGRRSGNARAVHALMAARLGGQVELLFRFLEYKEAPLHPLICPIWHNSPCRCDLKAVPVQFEEACLLGAHPFGVPSDIDLRNPFVPFETVHAGVGGHAV